MAFDAVILVLTVTKVNAHHSAQSKVGYLIYRDSLLYFLLTAAANVTVLVIEALDSDYNLIKPNAVPFATLITVTMSSRVFLNLKLFNQRQDKVNQGLPVHSCTSSLDGQHQRYASSKYNPSTVAIAPPMPVEFDLPFQSYEHKQSSNPDFMQIAQGEVYTSQ